jgi:hypothetical protein
MNHEQVQGFRGDKQMSEENWRRQEELDRIIRGEVVPDFNRGIAHEFAAFVLCAVIAVLAVVVPFLLT